MNMSIIVFNCRFVTSLKKPKVSSENSFINSKSQKQPSRGVLSKRCSENMQQIYRRTPMPKCDFNKVACNFIEITLRHGCFPVNLLHIFGTPFLKNTSGRLLLQLRRSDNFRYLQFICSIKICDIDLLSEISPTKKILKIFPISFLEVYE